MSTLNPDFLEAMDAGVTVCDSDLKIVYMNKKSKAAFLDFGGGDLIGKSLADCHKPESTKIIREILASKTPNVYTVSKKGQKKLIWQGPWFKDGEVAGLVELSIPLPEELPHRDRG